MMKKLNDCLINNVRIAIFGAGYYAKRVCEYFFFHNRISDVDVILVSDSDGNPNTLYEKEVIPLEDFSTQLYNYQVIIAVSPRMSDEIEEAIKKYKPKRIIRLYDGFIDDLHVDIFNACSQFPLQSNKIFFDAFDGGGYCCNCKYVAEELIKEQVDVEMVWNVVSKEGTHLPNNIKVVIRDTPSFYKELYTSGIIITNNSLPVYIKKRKGQYWISTWHGIGPTKKVGIDVGLEENRASRKTDMYIDRSRFDLMIAASDFCEQMIKGAFAYGGEIAKWGYPRNDILINGVNTRDIISSQYGIESDKRIILYAPTFRRSFYKDRSIASLRNAYDLDFKMVLAALRKRFGSEFTLLYRFHHVVYRGIDTSSALFPFGINLTEYDDMQELLLASDILITDYSSSMWDFSLTRKPVFLYFNDKEECENEVGFYRDPDTYPYPKGHTTKELCEAIESFDNESYQKALDDWFEEYGTYDDGHASERVANRILDVIDHPEKYRKDR